MVEAGLVAREKAERQRRRDTKFFAEPPARRRGRALARTRMAATGVRPQTAGVIFAAVALLQKNTAAPLDDEDRERSMVEARAMHVHLAAGADGAIALVDENQRLVVGRPHHRRLRSGSLVRARHQRCFHVGCRLARNASSPSIGSRAVINSSR